MKNEKYIFAFRLVWLDMKARRYALAAFASIIVHAIFSLFETLIIAIVAVGLVGNMEVSVAEAPPWLASFIDYGGWLIPLFFIVYSMSYISFGFLHYSVQNLGARIGLLLFEARSRDPNILALQTGNGELINDIGVEITRLSQQVLPPIATCFAKAINIFVLAGYSLYLLPGPTLIAALVFCSAYLAVWLLMKKSTQGLSAKVAMLLNHRMNFLSDYTKGYKFFWASRGHSRVVVRLEQIFKEYASSQARVAFNAYAPKASIEMIAMCLFGFYVFSYNPKVPDSKFFSFYELSQLGAITLKLLPSFSGFFGAFVVMRANSSAWDVFLRNGKSLFEKQTPEIKSTGTVFPIDMQLPKGFEPQKITISDPQIVLFEGASGSGKTSFFDRLIGLRKPQDLINSKALENVIGRNLFAYVPQENFTFEGTIADNLFWDEESDIDYLKSVWVACGLGSLSAGAFDPSLHVYPRKISGGQSQRLAIARALLENKPILILDESFAGIDTESAIKILDATKDQFGHTIFLSSHNSEIKDRADLVVEVRKP